MACMPRQPKKNSSSTFFERILYVILLAFIRFFISVGDLTLLLVRAPFKLLGGLYNGAVAFLIALGKYASRLFKKIKLKPRKLKLPQFKKPKPIDWKKFTALLKSILWDKPRAFLSSLASRIKIAKKPPIPKEQIALFPKKPRKRRLPFFSIKTIYFFVGFICALLVIFFNQTYQFVKNLPSPRNIGKVNYPLSTHIFDRNGRLLYEIYREQNRTPVKLDSLPRYVHEASVAVEDKDFFRHGGVSPIGGMVRAMKDTLINKQLQGGSTITQQLVKSALLTPERTISRKSKEIILALWTERLYSKQEILEMYLNQVPYGGSAYGIQEAAKTYFNKDAKDLTLSQAAFLAGLPQAPSIYSPYVNPDLAQVRRNEVLKKMLEQNYITQSQYQEAVNQDLTIEQPKTNIKAPHFVFFAKDELIKQFGSQEVEEGGLRVTTTLDLEIQEKAEQILKEELDKISNLNVSNGAILVTRPSTGEILAMVGSVDYFATPSGAFNDTTALRQPGSSIKPLMYSLALEKGYTAASIIDDSPVVFKTLGETYAPVNYDGKFHGRLPLRMVLANSLNVPAVKTLNTLGVNNFVDRARRLGITTWTDPSRFGLSLTLGGGEVKMVDMAQAFGVFANLGNRAEVSPLLKVSDVTNGTIYHRNPLGLRVLDPGISYILSDILSDNNARTMEFGTSSALEIPGYKVAVKTGTTDVKKDNWTIGYTPEFLVATWVGNNNNSPMNQQLASGITGAAPIWNRMMTYLLTEYSQKNTWFNKPDDLVEKSCYGGKIEYFLKGTENTPCQFRPENTPTPTP